MSQYTEYLTKNMLWGHESSRIFREYGCLDLGKQQQSYSNYRSEVERDFYAYVWRTNQKVYIVIELQVLWMKVLYVHKSLNRKKMLIKIGMMIFLTELK